MLMPRLSGAIPLAGIETCGCHYGVKLKPRFLVNFSYPLVLLQIVLKLASCHFIRRITILYYSQLRVFLLSKYLLRSVLLYQSNGFNGKGSHEVWRTFSFLL